MNTYTFCIMIAVLSVTLSSCGGTATMINAKSQSGRTDVFTEATEDGARDQKYAALVIRANIKTHEAGYYGDESGNSLHGKPGYPFVLNIDGQAVIWKVDGQKDVKPDYDEQGNKS